MLRKVRKNYKRLVAFLLSAAMIITNVGGNAGTVFAAEGQEERESAIFMVDGQEILEAIQGLKDQVAFSKEDLEEMGLDASRKGVLKKYEKLLLPEEGKVYELALNINTELALEGTALQVFYNGKTKEVIFLYMNESGQSVDCYVNIDGYETKVVTVEANDANVTAGVQETTAGEETGEEPGNGSGGSGSSGGGSGSTGGSGGSGNGGSGSGSSGASDGQSAEDGTSGEATEGSKEEASSADEGNGSEEDADKASEEETKAEAPKEESKADETGSAKEESKSEADGDGKEQPEKGTDGKDDKDEKESADSDKAENGGEEADKKETESAKPEGSGQDKGTSDKDGSQKPSDADSGKDTDKAEGDAGKEDDSADKAGDQGSKDDKEDAADKGSDDAKGDSADKADGSDSKEDSADKADGSDSKEDSADKADSSDSKEDSADKADSSDSKEDSADKADSSDSKEDSADKADDSGSKGDSADKADGGSDDASSSKDEDKSSGSGDSGSDGAGADSSNDGGSSDRHDGNRLSLSMSRHQAGIVAIQLDEIQDEGEAEEETTTVEETEEETEEETTTVKETEEETEKETKAEAVKEETEGNVAEEETTEKATEKETEAETTEKAAEKETEAETTEKADKEETAKEESKAEETEKATETAAETKETEKETVKAEESTEPEMDSEQGAEATGEGQEESKETQSQEEAETTVSEESADKTADESKEESSKAEGESKADGSGQGGADNSQSNGEELSDDWEIPGKVYDTVTIQETINARAYCVELQYVQKIVEATKGEEIVPQEYQVDYVVNPSNAAKVVGKETVAEGDSLIFAVEPEEGFGIIAVYVNGEEAVAVENTADLEGDSDWSKYAYVYQEEIVSEDLEVVIELEEEIPVIQAAVYTAETDDAVFTVNVPGGAFKEAVMLQVEKIEDEQTLKALTDQAEAALEKQKTVSSLLAYDITFISQETGEEKEPEEAVSVSIRMKEALVSDQTEQPDQAEEKVATGVSVVHLPENGAAEVVATAEDVKENNFEFEAESFSIYAVAMLSDVEAVAVIGDKSFDSLQNAINSIGEGEQGVEIVLTKDVTENIVSTEKSYTLDMKGHTVNGGGKGSVFTITNKKGGTVTLKNGTITGGKAEIGGGIHAIGGPVNVKPEFSLNVENCTIIENTATKALGGGISLDGGTSSTGSLINGTWETVNVVDNSGGGVYIKGVNTFSGGGTTLVSKNNLSLKNITISGNTSVQSRIYGAGGLTIDSSTLNIEECNITGNSFKSSPKSFDGTTGGFYSKANAIITFSGGKIQNNSGYTSGGIYWGGGNVTIKDVVIKNNVCTSKNTNNGNGSANGLLLIGGAQYSTFKIESGAVYNNGKEEQFDIYCNLNKKIRNNGVQIIAANKMVDPEMGDDFFTDKGYNYSWKDGSGALKQEDITLSSKQTGKYNAVAGKAPTKVAKIGEAEYITLTEAVANAKANDTIQLIFAEGNPSIYSTLDRNVIEINKPITVDLFGGGLKTASSEGLFKIVEGGELKLTNSRILDGAVSKAEGNIEIAGGKFTLDTGVDISIGSTILHNGDTFAINGSHTDLEVSLGQGKNISMGNEFSVESISLAMDAKTLDYLKGVAAKNDIIIFTGTDKTIAEDVSKKIKVKDLALEDCVAILVDEVGNIILHKSDQPGVYLNGISGDDENNTGFEVKSPVKTFKKAAEILQENESLDTIYIAGAVTVSENVTWSLPQGQLKRYVDYDGTLINVTGTLTLQDIIIDGAGQADGNSSSNDLEGAVSKAALITVSSNGTLNITEGTVLQNNIQRASSNIFFEGGGVTNNGTLNMSGGKIQYNHAYLGGGVHNRGIFRMSGGEIYNNTADGSYGTIGTGERGACGGGVYVIGREGQGMEMTGGIISYNKATGTRSSGAGISLGSRNDNLHKGLNASLVMNGGTITQNHADGWGGGINMSIGEAHIYAGDITSNSAQGSKSGLQNDYWIGGGIYVDKQATLNIKNVEIANNTAQWGGGGIAACPTATVEIYRVQGGVIHDNRSKDVYKNYLSDIVINQTNYRPEISINSHMLGGGEYNWRYSSSKGEGKLVPYDVLHQKRLESGIEIYSNGNEADIRAGASDCDVRITNNRVNNKGNSVSARGGGIAVNGRLILGEAGGYRIVHTYFTKYLSGDVKRDGAREPILRNEIKLDKEIATDGKDAEGRNYVDKINDFNGSQYEFVDYGLYYALVDARDVEYNEATKELTITSKEGIKTTYANEEVIVDENGKKYAVSYSIIVDKSGDKTIYLDYVRPTFTLDIEKLWRGDNNNAGGTRKPVTVQVVRKYDHVVVAEVKLDINSDTISRRILEVKEDGKAVMVEVPEGKMLELPGNIKEYIIKEDMKDLPEYSDSYKIKTEEASGNQHHEVTVTNTYGKPDLNNLVISKEVVNGTADNGAEDIDWNFLLTLTDENGNPLDVVNGNDDGVEDQMGLLAFQAILQHKNGEKESFVLELPSNGQLPFVLKHGESLTIEGLPVGTLYTVIEREANNGECTTTVNGGEALENEDGINGSRGSIEKDTEAEIKFVNTFLKRSDLTISKKVVNGTEDNGAESNEWHFTVVLKDKDGNSLNTVNAGKDDVEDMMGLLTFKGVLTHKDGKSEEIVLELLSDDRISFTLKHRESLTIKGLPVGTQYTVIEQEANNGECTTTVNGGTPEENSEGINGSKGFVEADRTTKVEFVNTFLQYSTLTVDKKVVNGTKDNHAEDKNWNFTVTLKDKNGNSYNRVDADADDVEDIMGVISFKATLTHKDNTSEELALELSADDTVSFALKHGESITIKVPVGTQYTVKEEEADKDDCVTTVKGRNSQGEITETDTKVEFINTFPELVDCTVRKVWDDSNDQEGLRPASIVVQLMANGRKSGDSVTLNQGNSWQYSWKDLPTVVDGEKIVYTVAEISQVPGYTTTYSKDTFTITNHLIPEETTPEETTPEETTPTEPTTPEETTPTEPTTPEETSPSEEPTTPEETSPSEEPTTPEETSPSEEPTTPEETTPTEPTTPAESPENPTTPSRPSGGGGGGGGRDRDRNPSLTPEPTPIPPEEVPLANIDPEDVPLAMMPSESPAEAMVIDDEGVPLFGLPRTGDRGVATGALIGMMLLSLMAACGIHVKKRKEEE